MAQKALLIAVAIATVLCLLAAQTSAFQVDVYEQKHFKGTVFVKKNKSIFLSVSLMRCQKSSSQRSFFR
jgi:hypothetical protein